MSMNEMESKLRELRSLQRFIEEAQQEAEAIKDGIKAQLTARGVDELQAGEYRVTWKAVTSRACHYILDMGHSRGEPVQSCTKKTAVATVTVQWRDYTW